MNKRPFMLETARGYGTTVPDDGESVGDELKLAAERREKEFRERNRTESSTTPAGELNDYTARRVAQLYHLAADAYEQGASVSIGHNRTDRYESAAKRCRDHAEELERKYCSK